MGDYITFLKAYAEFAKGNLPLLLIPVVVMIIWLFSGCYSASIAETRVRSPWIHFFLGLVIPILYPLIILFKLPVYVPPTESESDKSGGKVKKMEGPPPVETAPPALAEAGPAIVDTQMVDSPNIAFDKNYFKQIAVDMSGVPRGPFIFKVKGDELKVERILEAMDDVVMVEFVSADGKTQNIRFPYQNIESCKEI